MTTSRMTVACLGIFLLFSGKIHAQVVSNTTADPAAEVTWSESVARAQAVTTLATRVDEGRKLYEMCSECHLATGTGQRDGTMPQLAGQHRNVLIKQLTDIRSGIRKNPAMQPFVDQLEGSQELVDVASYIAELPISGDNGKGPGVDLDRGKDLYEQSCARCHGVHGEGAGDAFYPRLTGQHYRYMVRQIIDIAGGRRGNANLDMVEAVTDFSARDVSNVADYVSRLRMPPAETRE